jgi:hypothetical protein
MTERINKCPECFALYPDVVEIHNLDTHDFHTNATLQCWDCLHIWEDEIPSPRYESDKANGWII